MGSKKLVMVVASLAAAAVATVTIAVTSAASAASKQTASAATAHKSPYAGRTIMAHPVGIDRWHRIIFRTATWVPGGLDGGHFRNSAATAALPFTAAPAIRSAVTYCPTSFTLTMDKQGNGTKVCTTAAFVNRLSHGYVGYATMTVDRNSQITKLVERYTP